MTDLHVGPTLVLLATYLALGMLCAVVLVRRETTRGERITTVTLSVLAWPLWAPVALARETPSVAPRVRHAAARRIELALDEALAAVRGTQLASLLPEPQVRDLCLVVARSARRIDELESMIERPDLDPARAELRVEELLHGPRTSTRMLASARVHLDNARKLARLLAHEQRFLDELADLAEALRTQLVLARYAGSSLEGVGDIVGEVWARVQGIESAMDDASEAVPREAADAPPPRAVAT